jgi:GrpB-like predicted nucleotidyltransferase (UPF0157 family)
LTLASQACAAAKDVIAIIPYDSTWATAFDREAERLSAALRGSAVRIEHVGSTSVPGLAAKPVIDIQVSVEQLLPLQPYTDSLQGLGYRFVSVGDFDAIYPLFAKPGEWPSTHHVHLCVAGGEQEGKHLAFRNFLRNHPEAASTYADLKRKLAAENHGETLESRERYSLAKSDFVQSILTRAGFRCAGRP